MPEPLPPDAPPPGPGTPAQPGPTPEDLRREGFCAAFARGRAPCLTRHGECKAHCGAALRGERRGKYCPTYPMPNGRCRMHGGVSGTNGVAAPGFKSGKYSKFLPAGLKERYEQAISDEELVSLRDELGMMDVRLAELAQRLQGGEAGQLWGDLRAAEAAFTRAMEAGDTGSAGQAMKRISELIRRGGPAEGQWEELLDLIQKKARVAQAEWKRLSDLQQVLTAEQAQAMLAHIQYVILEHVKDVPTLQALSRAFRDLSAGRAPPRPVNGRAITDATAEG